jgi:hypothetical protein
VVGVPLPAQLFNVLMYLRYHGSQQEALHGGDLHRITSMCVVSLVSGEAGKHLQGLQQGRGFMIMLQRNTSACLFTALHKVVRRPRP